MPRGHWLPSSLRERQESSLNEAGHPPERKPSPPITAEDECQTANQTAAMTQPYLHNEMGRGTQHKHRKKPQN